MKIILVLATLIGLSVTPAVAHEGHDHGGDEKPAAGSPILGDRPLRLPDGTVFLPKLSQRRFMLRTVIAEIREVPISVELNAHVVMDPNAGGRVQSTQAGRIEAGPNGLPVLGQSVRKGEVLAYVKPAIGSVERANQTAQIAELKAALGLAEKKLARQQALEGTVPRKEIEATQAEMASLKQRVNAIRGGIDVGEALLAPADGVVARADVVAGQVVDAKDVLFEIIDPKRLMIEAIAYDASTAAEVKAAMLAGDGTPLRYVGGARSLRDGALPMLFRFSGASPMLAVGQPVKVIAKTSRTLKGVPLPAAAVVRNPSNESIVWVHDSAERFRPITVTVRPLDGQTVVATGLADKARVVVTGAPLLNQIR